MIFFDLIQPYLEPAVLELEIPELEVPEPVEGSKDREGRRAIVFFNVTTVRLSSRLVLDTGEALLELTACVSRPGG